MFTYVPKGAKAPIKVWLDRNSYFKDKVMVEQCENMSGLPFAYKHIVLTPDGHQGYGVPIGGIIACTGIIIPHAVGSDCGCGMIAVRTSLTGIDVEVTKKIMGKIRETVPVGFNHHRTYSEERESLAKEVFTKHMGVDKITEGQFNSKIKEIAPQLGTLGGG